MPPATDASCPHWDQNTSLVISSMLDGLLIDCVALFLAEARKKNGKETLLVGWSNEDRTRRRVLSSLLQPTSSVSLPFFLRASARNNATQSINRPSSMLLITSEVF